ncbi:MAG: tRNA (adenosine(37)-N6)-threonylcarbamoyltransferase complex ATPase subunit type 1 TsaE [Alphaproteobacteria bacterium]|nr:tRNA (adenosine(37)-N6)-threonylcarbamoyltransferase complex ATPase subunit type 1 TsaE [Alphaproteobacteria bacterium]
MPTLLLNSEKETLALGTALARVAEPGDVITLSGPLGAGKTVLARGFIAERIGAETDVASPTFTLAHVYDSVAPPIWHFDFYRIDTPQDVEELGLDDALAGGISVIEWPERATAWLPNERLDIILANSEKEDARTATLSASPQWASRMETLLAERGTA